MEYKASKKANNTDHAIPLCDRRIPSWIATAYLHSSDQKHATRYKENFYTPPPPRAAGKTHCASIPPVSQSVPLMAHCQGHILNPAIATPTRSGWIVPGLSRNSPGTSASYVNCAKIELVAISRDRLSLTSYWPQSRLLTLTSSSILTSVCADSLLVATVTAIRCLSAESSILTSTSQAEGRSAGGTLGLIR